MGVLDSQIWIQDLVFQRLRSPNAAMPRVKVEEPPIIVPTLSNKSCGFETRALALASIESKSLGLAPAVVFRHRENDTAYNLWELIDLPLGSSCLCDGMSS